MTEDRLFGRGLLRWLNLRPEESERTFLMFAFYTATSMGLVWLEASTVALFLEEYNVDRWLPIIYIASAFIGSSLGFLYSRLQKVIPLRRAVVIVALLIALPILGFWLGLGMEGAIAFEAVTVFSVTVFIMRLWLEAVYVLHDLNTSITANQLFNIREIKRAYPLISSGILVADVLSGFSLHLIVGVVKDLKNVILIAFVLMAIGAGILFHLCQTYSQSFPDSPRRRMQERELDFTSRRLQGPLRRYVTLLLGFFVIAQILFLLVDFQFLNQLQQQASPQESAMTAAEIAGFLGMFNGALGVCELLMQWLAASRVIERLGVFATAMLMPGALAVISSFSTAIAVSGLTTSRILFFSLVILKFVDELLHYTLFAGISPVLFQPIPDTLRSNLQAMVRGVAEPLATGATGLSILGLVWVNHQFNPNGLGVTSLLVATVLLSLAWFMVIWFLRLQYVGLLVISAERGQLSVSDVDLKELKRAVVEALDRPGTDADKRSCIELLSHIDARNLGEVIAPLLHRLPPLLQRQGLEAMLNYPNPSHLEDVRSLLAQKLHPEVLAVALRYIWLTEANPDVGPLRSYLNPATDPVVRGTAASLMLRRGNPREKAEATETLRRMLTHERELERVKGCLALGEAVYLQSLRLHIDKLLQDESLRVRCALLEAIAATHLEEYYPSLIRGLRYKSTRAAAMRALERLENEAIPMLAQLASDPQTTDPVRSAALSTIGKIGTLEAKDALVNHLMTAWGNSRRIALRILLHLPREEGIDAVADNLGRSGIETLINQELLFIGQMYACLVDLSPDQISGMEAELLRRALHDMQSDAIQRLFLLMRFLYPSTAIKAAAFNLQADSQPENMARGLEILDNTVDLPSKRILLTVLDRRSDYEKLESLANLVPYAPLSPSQRLRELVELRHFLSDWALACCFHVARQAHWSLTAEQTLSCLRHSTGFVREAVLAYLRAASPRTLKDLLPRLSHDRDRLVLSQVKALMQEMGMDPAVAPPIARPKGAASRPERSGLETV